MGASAEGEYKRQRDVLSRLKKIAVVIAILDLILAINDSRNVGRFFLLLTMSSSFDTSPENVIRDHCLENVEGICETYFSTIAGRVPDVMSQSFQGKPSHNYGTTSDFHRYLLPETFKELVNSWIAIFDESRADANVSFYYDGGGGLRDRPLSSSPPSHVPHPQQTYLVDNKYNISDSSPHQSHLNSSGIQVNSGESKHSSLAKKNPTPPHDSASSARTTNSTHAGRKKRGLSPNRERNSADTGETLREPAKHANPPQAPATSASPQVLQNFKGITPAQGDAVTTVHIPDDLASTKADTDMKFSITRVWTGERLKERRKPMPPIAPQVFEGGRKEFSTGNDQQCRLRSTNTNLPDFDNGIMSKGPKKLITFVQDEVFTRWPCLLQKVRDVLEHKNISSSASPEASRIKMFIEVRPFGPDSFKNSRKRLKATQQILFDYPWLTMFHIHSRLSGAFTKMFVVISLYTWIWGTVIALMLLIGSLKEDQTTLHGWIIFNILYSLLLFMIDDWIHSNIGPHRSSLSVWLFVMYSLYKPIAAWIGFTQWSEMKKVVSLDPATSSVSNSKCLNRVRSSGGGLSRKRGFPSSSSSDGTTMETTVVQIITPTPTPALPTRRADIGGASAIVSTLGLELAQDDGSGDSGDGEGNCDDVDIEEFEDLDDDGEDLEMDEDDSDSEEDGETKDLVKVGRGNDDEE